MYHKIVFSFLVAFLLCKAGSHAQVNKTVQPKIMVMPKVAKGGDMKKLYDTSSTVRMAMAKINEAFLKREANIVSFDAKLKEAEENIGLNKAAGNEDDFKSLVLQMSGADIYVTADITVVKQQRNLNSVTIILEGYQNGTSNFLGVKEGRSRMNQTEDIGLLCSQAMDTITDGFLNQMQVKFNDIRENGQSIAVQFTVAPGAQSDFDTELGTPAKSLAEHIEEWVTAHAVKGVYNNQGIVSNMMILSDVRIPLKNPANPNSNYTGQSFYNDLNKFFKSLQVKIRREISTNNKILITIL